MKPIYNEEHEEKLYVIDPSWTEAPLARMMQQQGWLNHQRSLQADWIHLWIADDLTSERRA